MLKDVILKLIFFYDFSIICTCSVIIRAFQTNANILLYKQTNNKKESHKSINTYIWAQSCCYYKHPHIPKNETSILFYSTQPYWIDGYVLLVKRLASYLGWLS
jgi:hypothetical protein